MPHEIPKAPFRQGFFDPALAKAAQNMYESLKGGPPGGGGVSGPPSLAPAGNRGGSPGGAP